MTKTVKADLIYRRRFFVSLILLIGGLFIAIWAGLLNLGSYLDGLEGGEWLKRFRLLFIVILTPVLLLGVYFIYFGLNVVRAGEFPPPGHKVISDTNIQEGKWAILRGRVLVLLGVCMFLISFYGAVIVPNQFEKMMNENISGEVSNTSAQSGALSRAAGFDR
ncbi:MAG: hypothetical protein ABW201_11825 [Candidatus Thiodiazotropha sp.]